MVTVRSLRTGIKYKDTPIGKIPVDWEVLALANVAEIIMGQSPLSQDCHDQEKGLPFYQGNADFGAKYPTPRRWCNNPLKKAQKGDILISVRAPVGEVNVAPHDCIIGRGLSAIRASRMNQEFLYQSVLFFRNSLERVSQGSTFEAINNKELSTFLISAPPLSEQRRIAEILATVDNAIEESEKIIEKTNELKKGLMQKLLTRGIGHKKFKKTEIGVIPVTWEVAALTAFAQKTKNTIVNGPFGSDLLAKEHTDEGVPVIYVRDIKPDRYERVSTVCVTREKADKLNFCNVQHGDVLLAKVGDPPCDAAPYIVKERAIITQDVIRIRPGENVDTIFLCNLLNSSWGRNAVETIKIAGTRSRVSLTQLKKILLPKPPLNEQKRIAIFLNHADSEINYEKSTKGNLENIKKSLMQVLLTGKVRVQ